MFRLFRWSGNCYFVMNDFFFLTVLLAKALRWTNTWNKQVDWIFKDDHFRNCIYYTKNGFPSNFPRGPRSMINTQWEISYHFLPSLLKLQRNLVFFSLPLSLQTYRSSAKISIWDKSKFETHQRQIVIIEKL